MKVEKLLTVLLICAAAIGAAEVLRDSVSVSSNVNGRELPVTSVETGKAAVALTFETAWADDDLEKILEVLKEEEVRASFFMTGEWSERHPELVRKIRSGGHDLGNLSWTHRSMTGLAEEEKEEEIRLTEETLFKITGKRPDLFRPPYGNYDDGLIRTAKAMGYETVTWSIDTKDWKDYGKQAILKEVLSGTALNNGAVIRAHTGTTYMAEALRPLIRRVQERGFVWEPLSELILRENYHMDVTGRQIPDQRN